MVLLGIVRVSGGVIVFWIFLVFCCIKLGGCYFWVRVVLFVIIGFFFKILGLWSYRFYVSFKDGMIKGIVFNGRIF